jgi:hypothetical protein
VTDAEILILNERLKAISNLLFNLAGALIVGVMARVWADGSLGFVVACWIVVALIIIWAAYKTLNLLEA